MTEIKMSIVVPTYRRNGYLQQNLKRLEQVQRGFPEVEVLVMDAGGTAQCLQRKFPTISIIEKVGRKIWETFNDCISASRGAWILIFHDDDLIGRQLVPTYLDAIQRFPDVGMIFSYPMLIDAHNKILGKHDVLKLPFCILEPGVLTDVLRTYNCITAPGVLVKRDCYDVVGRFGDYQCVLDWDMWLRISLRYRVLYIPHPLFYYRLHNGQLSHQVLQAQKQAEERLINEKYKRKEAK